MASTFRALPVDSTEAECSSFEAQTWRKDRCKKCFKFLEQHRARTKSKNRLKKVNGACGEADVTSHDIQNSGENKTSEVDASVRKTKLVILTAEVSVDGNPEAERISVDTSIGANSPPHSPVSSAFISLKRAKSPDSQSFKSMEGSIVGSAEYLSARSTTCDGRSMSRTTSYESVASTLHGATDDTYQSVASTLHGATGDKFRVVAVDVDDETVDVLGGGLWRQRDRTPTSESLNDASAMRAQLEIMQLKCDDLERENFGLRKISSEHGNDVIEELRKNLGNSEETCQLQKDHIKKLENEMVQLRVSAGVRIPVQDQRAEVDHLKMQLESAEQLCEEVMEENENLKNDLRGLQQELDEVRDQYREEEIDEFRDLQRELEQTAKNCRILQFKLRKAERRSDQTEADKEHLQEKIKEILVKRGSPVDACVSDSDRLHELQSELRIAKEVSVRLHNELENMEEKRCKLEDENFCLRERIREMEARDKIVESLRNKPENQKKANNESNSSDQNSHSYSNNESQFLRNLQDSLERETDLKDQLKFAENDVKIAYKKISDLETENECLIRHVAKQASSTQALPQRENPIESQPNKNARPPMKRSFSEGHTQIELELAEHEAHVLKAKLEKMERDNECMVSKISLLEKEASRCGGKIQFSDDEIRYVVPDTYYKQKIKILEEELEEWKIKFDTMQKVEADQDQLNASRKLAKKSMSLHKTHSDLSVDSISTARPCCAIHREGGVTAIKPDALEGELGLLHQKLANYAEENEKLINENKRLASKRIYRKQDSNILTSSNVENSQNEIDLNKKISKMEKDIYRFIGKISEMEKENETLKKEVERRKKLEHIKRDILRENDAHLGEKSTSYDNLEIAGKISSLTTENAQLVQNIKSEQVKSADLEEKLSDYKQLVGMSENSRLVTMASRVEILTNQFKQVQNRYETIHKKLVSSNGSCITVAKYEDALKERIEFLERALSEEKSKNILVRETSLISNCDDASNKRISDFTQILAVVENQVELIFSRVESLESEQQYANGCPINIEKSSLNGEDQVKLLSDILSVKSELDSLRSKLKERGNSENLNIPEISQNSNFSPQKFRQQERTLKDLQDQYDLCKQEKSDALRECEKATSRLLQTEERWNKELEKLRESYENQVKDLKYYLQEAERINEEKSAALFDKTSLLNEKSKRLGDCEIRLAKVEGELKSRHKDLQDKLDVEKRRAKDFETKYQKLENLFDNEKLKSTNEKEKFKQDLSDIKKRYDETRTDFEKLKNSYEKKEQNWGVERRNFESKLAEMRQEVNETELKVTERVKKLSSMENQKLISSLDEQKRHVEGKLKVCEDERCTLTTQLENKVKDFEKSSDELGRTVREMDQLKSKISGQKEQLDDARRTRDETKEELSRWQQTWTKERAELGHKMRQEEKVQQAEQQALQLKYESRVKIMEDSSRRTQSQLTQMRRERDQLRDNAVTLDKKLSYANQKFQSEEKEWSKKIGELTKKAEQVDDLKISLERELREREILMKNYTTDKVLWSIQKEQLCDSVGRMTNGDSSKEISVKSSNISEKDKLITQSVELAKELRQQAEEAKKVYDGEVKMLKNQIKQLKADSSKEKVSSGRLTRDLQENLKIQEIDRLNLLSNRDQNECEKNRLQNEKDGLLARLQDAEIHQLANKYKLDKISENLAGLHVKFPDASSEVHKIMKKVLEQLSYVREDMNKTKELGKISSAHLYPKFDLLPENKTPIFSPDADSLSVKSAPMFDKKDGNFSIAVQKFTDSNQAASSSSLLCNKPPLLANKSKSVSSETAADQNWLTNHRLRSPSPNPRKITNYPDPPPSIIFNKVDGVEYDSDGRRHWTRKSFFQRSVSLDPAGGSNLTDKCLREPLKKLEAEKGDFSSEVNNLKSTLAVATSTTNLSLGSHSPGYRRRMIDIFATLRKSTSRERRRAVFRDSKPGSMDEPDFKDQRSKDLDNISDEHGKSRGFSGRKFLDKIRGRSSSRGTKKSGASSSRDPSAECPAAKKVEQDDSEILKHFNTPSTSEKKTDEKNNLLILPITVQSDSTSISSNPSNFEESVASESIRSTTSACKSQNSRGWTKKRANTVSCEPKVNTFGTSPKPKSSNFKPMTSSYGSVRMLSAKFLKR